VAALPADKTAIQVGHHLPKLIFANAVGATNHCLDHFKTSTCDVGFNSSAVRTLLEAEIGCNGLSVAVCGTLVGRADALTDGLGN
jgi:hypothetical protein